MTNPTDQDAARPAPQIDKEFQSLITRQVPEELGLLEASIVADGCRDAIVIWSQGGLILDGYTRYSICRGNGVAFDVKVIDLPDRAACIAWIARNQLGRRNLTEQQKDYLRGKRLEAEKGSKGRPEKCAQNERINSGRTEERLAEEYGVSPATIKRDAEFAKGVDKIAVEEGPEAREAILSGKDKRTKAEVAAAAKPDKPNPKAARHSAPATEPTAASDLRRKVFRARHTYGVIAEVSVTQDEVILKYVWQRGGVTPDLAAMLVQSGNLEITYLTATLEEMQFAETGGGGQRP
jgi:hypothetical protein